MARTPIPDATLKGYFAEGQRQNRCLYSQDFSNAAWVSGGGGITVTTNTAVAPDGATTADTLTASGANGTLIQDLGVVASAAKAGGLYLKRKTGTGNIDLTLDGGSTWTTVAVTSSWLLLEKTQTLADEDFGIRIVTSGDEVYAWQGQVETADFISSPIPTTTAAVTRNADVLSFVTSGNLSNTLGSIYAEVTVKGFALTRRVVGAYPLNISAAHKATTYDGATISTGNSVVDNSLNKMAAAWGTTLSISLNGGTVASGAFDGNMNVGASFYIGTVSGEEPYAPIKNARIWTKALSDAQLQSITT